MREGAGDGEAPGADRVSPGRATPRACGEPGGAGTMSGEIIAKGNGFLAVGVALAGVILTSLKGTESCGAIRGRTEVLGRFRAELEDRLSWERVSLGKAHAEAVRGIESKAGEFYRGGMEGSEQRAREAARSDGLLLDSYRRPDEFYRLKYSMLEERLEQVREIGCERT